MQKNIETPLPPDALTTHLRDELLSYLHSQTTMTLASCLRGVPWAAAVFYASDAFDLYFFSNSRSRHGVNMTGNSRVSAAIYGDCRDWRGIRGIQLEGRAEIIRSAKLRSRSWRVYRKKFPFVDELFQEGVLAESLKLKLSGIELYRLRPDCVWYLDNSLGFGYRQQLQLAPSRMQRAHRSAGFLLADKQG
jgi:uncharacterized protein YhbP (UPF0306 family)